MADPFLEPFPFAVLRSPPLISPQWHHPAFLPKLSQSTVLDPFCGTATTMVAALKHGQNSIGVECPSPHPMGRGTTGEVSHSQPSTAVALYETPPPYKTRTQKKPSRKRRSSGIQN